MGDKFVDYYAVLEVSPTATPEQIRTAYKKAALKWHPDRVPNDSPERSTRTKRFQQINDAYFTLSDPGRRRDYDSVRQWTNADTASEPADEDIPRPPPKKGGFGSWFPFGNARSEPNNNFENDQWSSVFEEMMQDTGMSEEEVKDGSAKKVPSKRFWTVVGGVSGGALGFIIGNFTGAVVGAGSGAKLGAIRDAHGKSVYEVFQELPQAEKAKVLSELATKLFAQAVSG